MALHSFAQSSGALAGKKEGGFSGQLLGKMAEGLEALEAIAELAAGKFNRFMSLAQEAVKTYAKRLDTLKTIPFANPDDGFNPTLNPQKAALRQQAQPAPGLGSKTRAKPKAKVSAKKKISNGKREE